MGIDSDCMGMERDGNVKLCPQLPVIWSDTPLNVIFHYFCTTDTIFCTGNKHTSTAKDATF